ncbi:hypothetical protein J1N35_028413 [Gossypium stocksii]|uniref:Uncharacterized protein n=1 Tax=Gossypium stocksii TaxID=47602 RepID=A0A9D3ZR35_9ROSI|nr:hypothetical protein J1N35_028413 [Gossypium stocksii]
MVKSYNHVLECVRSNKNNIISCKYIQEVFKDKILADPRMVVATLKEICKNELRVCASYNICQRARRGVLKEKKVFYIDEYVNLWGYVVELISSNPGSTVSILVTLWGYAYLAGLKQGWKEGYKLFILIDGCFLNSVCKRELLAVVGRDGNNQMFPVAWAVEGEGK